MHTTPRGGIRGKRVLGNPDQSICQGSDKGTDRRGQREQERIDCGLFDFNASTLARALYF